MADTREVVIKIVEGRNQGNGSAIHEKSKEQSEAGKIADFINNPSGSIINKISSSMDSPVKAYATYRIANEVVQLAKQSIDFAMTNVGRWTGDIGAVHQVQQIQVGLDIAKDIGNIGVSALSGLMIAGPVGAVVSAGISILNTSVKYGQQAYNYNVSISTDNRSVNFIKQRTGAELTNWSR